MYFEELNDGMKLELPPVKVDRDEMLSFAKRYNNAPIHSDEEYAKTTPFGRIIAPGLLTYLLVWSRYIENDFFGEELVAGKSAKIEWHKPVFADDILTGKAGIAKLSDNGRRHGTADLSIDIYNQNGELVLSSITETVVKKKTYKA